MASFSTTAISPYSRRACHWLATARPSLATSRYAAASVTPRTWPELAMAVPGYSAWSGSCPWSSEGVALCAAMASLQRRLGGGVEGVGEGVLLQPRRQCLRVLAAIPWRHARNGIGKMHVWTVAASPVERRLSRSCSRRQGSNPPAASRPWARRGTIATRAGGGVAVDRPRSPLPAIDVEEPGRSARAERLTPGSALPRLGPTTAALVTGRRRAIHTGARPSLLRGRAAQSAVRAEAGVLATSGPATGVAGTRPHLAGLCPRRASAPRADRNRADPAPVHTHAGGRPSHVRSRHGRVVVPAPGPGSRPCRALAEARPRPLPHLPRPALAPEPPRSAQSRLAGVVSSRQPPACFNLLQL